MLAGVDGNGSARWSERFVLVWVSEADGRRTRHAGLQSGWWLTADVADGFESEFARDAVGLVVRRRFEGGVTSAQWRR